VDDSKHASTDASAEADEDEPQFQEGNPPVDEATHAALELGDTLENGSNVITSFDCACYSLYVSRH
jgi:hypothetical protein